jgi:FtsZ-binding cell division protein ZapB
MTKKILMTVFACAVSCALPASVEPSMPEETRALLQEWVRVRALISEEREQWSAEREDIIDTIKLLKIEQASLREQISEREAAASEATSEREVLLAKRESLDETAAQIATILARHEASVREWKETLPNVLKSDIDPLLRRLPATADSANALGLGRRLQTIVGILSQADRFNSTLTFRRELREDPATGASRETDTLYFGLAMAVYSDSGGSVAGFGFPAETGWSWVNAPENAGAIRELMAIYRNEVRATYVGIPLRVQ